MNPLQLRRKYRPGAPEPVSVVAADRGFTLEMRRFFQHSPEQVWRLLTEPAELRQWAPFDTTFDLGETGTSTLSTAGTARPIDLPSHIRIAERARLLEYTWGSDVLVWELEPLPAGTTVVTLRHTMGDSRLLARVAAGWQICFDVAERYMNGVPIGRIAGPQAVEFDFVRLQSAHATRLLAPDAALPEDFGRSVPPPPPPPPQWVRPGAAPEPRVRF